MNKEIISPYLIDCLDRLVGITRTQCECYETLSPEKQAKISISISGLYLDEDTRLNNCLLLSKAKCGQNDVFDNIAEIKKKAAIELTMGLASELQPMYQAKVDKIVNYGSPNYGSLLTGLSSGKKSFTIETTELTGGIIHLQYGGFIALLPHNVWNEIVRINIDKISLNKESGEYERTNIYYYDFRIDNKSSWAGKKPDTSYTQLPDEGIELICDGSTYEIWYDYDSTKFTPYSNKVACGGCQKSMIESTMFYKNVPEGEAYGMMFSARIYCDPLSIVCSIVNSNKLLAMLIANALLCKTLEFVLYKLKSENSGILRTPEILQRADKKPVNLYDEMITNYGIGFQQYVKEIIEKLSLYDTKLKCFTCRTGQWGSRAGIIQ